MKTKLLLLLMFFSVSGLFAQTNVLEFVDGDFVSGAFDNWEYDEEGLSTGTAVISDDAYAGSHAIEILWKDDDPDLDDANLRFDHGPHMFYGCKGNTQYVFKSAAKATSGTGILKLIVKYWSSDWGTSGELSEATWVLTDSYVEHEWAFTIPTEIDGGQFFVGYQLLNADGSRWPVGDVTTLIDEIEVWENAVPARAATVVWNPAANSAGTGLWNEYANWTDGRIPADASKVVFNVTGAQECVLDDSRSIHYMVQGDNNEGGTLRIADGGTLNTGVYWSGIGWTADATMIVDAGGTVNFGEHMWVGWDNGSAGTVILDGGTVNVAGMIGLGWNASKGTGTVQVKSGELNVARFDAAASIGTGSLIEFSGGTMNITGDHVTSVNDYVTAGKITAVGGTGTVRAYYDADPDKTIVTQLPERQAAVWWSPGANSNGLWSDFNNWHDGRVPLDNKVVFGVGDVEDCVLDVESTILQFVIGDNAVGDTLRIADGGILNTSSTVWSAVSYNNTGVMVIDAGGTVNCGERFLVGVVDGGDGTFILDGGTMNVGTIMGLGWSGTAIGTAYINSGIVNTPELRISDGSLLDIIDGTINIDGDVVSAINAFAAAGKITADGGSGELSVIYDSNADLTIVTSGPMVLPTILSVIPVDGATGVAVDSDIVIEFSELMDEASAEGAITINPTISNTSFAWTNNTLTISGDNMPSNTSHDVTVGVGATDFGGNALATDYSFSFTVAAATDASLSDLSIDGTTVSGFDAATLTYDVELAIGTTTIPVVDATETDSNASSVITQATALPGDATVVVTAEDGSTVLTYTVSFTVMAQETDASLSDLTVDGTTVSSFDAATLTYDVEITGGANIPVVDATLTDANASLVITQATAIPGDATVVVTAEDGTTIITYTVNFSFPVGIMDVEKEFSVSVYPNPATGGVLHITLNSIHNTENLIVTMVDLSGSIVYQKSIDNALREFDIVGLDNLEKGVYLLNISNGNYNKVVKVVF